MEKLLRNRLQMMSLVFWMLVIWLASNAVFELAEAYRMRANRLIPQVATEHLWTVVILGAIMVAVSFVYDFLRGTMRSRVEYLAAHRKKSDQRLTGKRAEEYTVLSDRNKMLVLVFYTGTQVGRIFFGANTLKYLWFVAAAIIIVTIYWLTEARSLGLKKEPKPILEKRANGRKRRQKKAKKPKKPGPLHWLFGDTDFSSGDEHDSRHHDYDQEGYRERDRRNNRTRYADPEDEDGEEHIFDMYDRDFFADDEESDGSDDGPDEGDGPDGDEEDNGSDGDDSEDSEDDDSDEEGEGGD